MPVGNTQIILVTINGFTKVSGAHVTVLDYNGVVVAAGTTDANGQVTFNLANGNFAVVATYTSSGSYYLGSEALVEPGSPSEVSVNLS